MDSAPPATTIEALPVMMVWAPRIMALIEEAQTLLTVVQTVESFSPAPRAHCLAGFCPRLEWVRFYLPIEWCGILCGKDVAKEYFLNIFWLDACTFDSSCLA
jgi:hypothetical protein